MAVEMLCSHPTLANWAIVAGNIRIEEAKIGGITPDELILRGRWVLCPPYILLPTHAFGVLDGDTALSLLHKNNSAPQQQSLRQQ